VNEGTVKVYLMQVQLWSGGVYSRCEKFEIFWRVFRLNRPWVSRKEIILPVLFIDQTYSRLQQIPSTWWSFLGLV